MDLLRSQFICAAALHYGDMDDHEAARMILAGIPLDEPYLQDQLSIFSKTEKKDLKAGKLPVSESYYLMGTVDPTGELKEDDVCVILYDSQSLALSLLSLYIGIVSWIFISSLPFLVWFCIASLAKSQGMC